MSNPATIEYIKVLENLKSGDLGLLRTHAGQGLDESVDGFDLFAGLWWPLRNENPRTPRRSVAWLIAKLHAAFPIRREEGKELAVKLRTCEPSKPEDARRQFRQKFDALLRSEIRQMEPFLRWALQEISHLQNPSIDWVKLTDDLSGWHQESKRREWATHYLYRSDKNQNTIGEE